VKAKGVKERILSTATRLFYSHGAKNTGINQIIEEAGVAKASFYQHFPSKEDLIVQCLDLYNLMISKVVRRFVARSRSLKDFFETWSMFIRRTARVNPAFNGCPIANIGFQIEPENVAIRGKFKHITSGWIGLVTPLFEKSKAAGEIGRNADVAALFREIIQINEGALIMWRLTGDAAFLDSLSSALLKLLR
jgi:AcrR family transcriptional regulator